MVTSTSLHSSRRRVWILWRVSKVFCTRWVANASDQALLLLLVIVKAKHPPKIACMDWKASRCSQLTVDLWPREFFFSQVPELLSEEVLTKMHAPPKPDVPILDVHDLPNADGFIFGFPTRCATHFSSLLRDYGTLHDT